VTSDDRAGSDRTLADLMVDDVARVLTIEFEVEGRLLDLGMRPGVLVSVESDAPFGGPRIVRLGDARLALARSVARAVRVDAR
jgi:Fe2+ transport system protein FeoA